MGSRLNQALHRLLKSLARDGSVKGCKFDKGRGVVILNSNDYYSKLNSMISDSTKFTEIPLLLIIKYTRTKHARHQLEKYTSQNY